jgi:hypothetical protein
MDKKRQADTHKMREKGIFYIHTKKMIATYDEIDISIVQSVNIK